MLSVRSGSVVAVSQRLLSGYYHFAVKILAVCVCVCLSVSLHVLAHECMPMCTCVDVSDIKSDVKCASSDRGPFAFGKQFI